MQLSEHKTYRTRDGSRTGIRVRRKHCPEGTHPWNCEGDSCNFVYTNEGQLYRYQQSCNDLIEEEPAFSFAACPLIDDGPRRRAVTRDGREVTLVNDDPIIGYLSDFEVAKWRSDGRYNPEGAETTFDLLVPPPPKRVVWVNLYDREDGPAATSHTSQADADKWSQGRLGNRAYPIEIDE